VNAIVNKKVYVTDSMMPEGVEHRTVPARFKYSLW